MNDYTMNTPVMAHASLRHSFIAYDEIRFETVGGRVVFICKGEKVFEFLTGVQMRHGDTLTVKGMCGHHPVYIE